MVECQTVQQTVINSTPMNQKQLSLYHTPVICILPPGNEDTKHERIDPCHYQNEILQILASLNFQDIAPRSSHTDKEPAFTATRNGRRCGICMQETAADIMHIGTMTEAQYHYCEEHIPEYDIFYCATYLASCQEYKMLAPLCVRTNAAWIKTEEAEQFLPFSCRSTLNSFAPLLGGAHVFKLSEIILPFLIHLGEPARFHIQGTCATAQLPAPPYKVLHVETAHSILALMQNTETGGDTLLRPCFYHCEPPHCTMLYTGCSINSHRARISLKSIKGKELHAESLDAVVIPHQLIRNQQYKWSLCLVAETVHLNSPTSTTRPCLHQSGNSPYTEIDGIIREQRTSRVCDRQLTVATIHFPEDATTLTLYLAPELSDRYPLNNGSCIHCTGLLQAVPLELISKATEQNTTEPTAHETATQRLDTQQGFTNNIQIWCQNTEEET